MKNIENSQIPNHIKKSVKKQLIVVFVILIISILFRNNVTALLIGTPRSLISIKNSTFLIIYFTAIFITIILGVVVFYIVSKKNDKNIKSEKSLKNFLIIFDISSFILLTTILITFFVSFVFTITTVSGDSMNDTFEDGDRVLVWHFHQRRRVNANVVIFLEEESVFILKRIRATSNDVLTFIKEETGGKLLINNEFESNILVSQWDKISNNQKVTKSDENSYYFTMPKNYYFVLGDNRNNSIDSRNFGLVRKENIVGTVVFRIFPLNNMGIFRMNR